MQKTKMLIKQHYWKLSGKDGSEYHRSVIIWFQCFTVIPLFLSFISEKLYKRTNCLTSINDITGHYELSYF